MARKRRLPSHENGPEDDDSPPDIPERYREKTWAQWAREDLSRYWYGVLCVLIDSLFTLELAYHVQESHPIWLTVMVLLIPLGVAEVIIYWWVWVRR